jgi:hypothetical protein
VSAQQRRADAATADCQAWDAERWAAAVAAPLHSVAAQGAVAPQGVAVRRVRRAAVAAAPDAAVAERRRARASGDRRRRAADWPCSKTTPRIHSRKTPAERHLLNDSETLEDNGPNQAGAAPATWSQIFAAVPTTFNE